MVMRFVIGQTSDQAQEADLMTEVEQYGGFMRLSLQVHRVACLAASALWPAVMLAEMTTAP